MGAPARLTVTGVERDLNRFRQIVRGKIKKDLRKYMSQGEMIGRQGRKSGVGAVTGEANRVTVGRSFERALL
jgi:hypothetical protein